MNDKTVIFIVGPTAVGKTAYAHDLACRTNGEIVSADSMQVYRGLDKGTAKPTPEEMESIPYHMIDVADPSEDYSVAVYRDEATSVINDIFSRGKIPIVCGGSGLYVHSLLFGLDFSGVNPDPKLRESLVKEANEGGAQGLFKKLEELDPEAAKRIHPNNVKKVIRAIERASGTLENQGIREFGKSFESGVNYDTMIIRLTMDRERLYERIDKRVDGFLADGLVEEVRGLIDAGIPQNGTAIQGIGYKEILKLFNGDIDYNEAVELIKQNSRRYAKRQETWFKRYEQAEVIVLE